MQDGNVSSENLKEEVYIAEVRDRHLPFLKRTLWQSCTSVSRMQTIVLSGSSDKDSHWINENDGRYE